MSIRTSILARFRDLRRKYPNLSTETLFSWAKAKKPRAIEWKESRQNRHGVSDVAAVQYGGLTVELAVKVDENGDASHLGEYSRRYEDGCIKTECDRGRPLYWHPTQPLSERREALYRLGYSRFQAQLVAEKELRSDFKRHQDLRAGAWWFVGVVATFRYNGIELHSESLWGIESDAGDYLDEVAADLMREGYPSALRSLFDLRKQFVGMNRKLLRRACAA